MWDKEVRPKFDLETLPLPIVHSNFVFNEFSIDFTPIKDARPQDRYGSDDGSRCDPEIGGEDMPEPDIIIGE